MGLRTPCSGVFLVITAWLLAVLTHFQLDLLYALGVTMRDTYQLSRAPGVWSSGRPDFRYPTLLHGILPILLLLDPEGTYVDAP